MIQHSASRQEVASRIQALKQQYGSELVILGHHYQSDEIIRHVDIAGDSLELARRIPEIEAQYIVFCGVYFMAESARLLARPRQKIFLPDHSADCAMARMAPADDVEQALAFLNGSGRHVVPLAYVNSSLAAKAVAGRFGGAVCTSSNARTMLEWALRQGDAVLFLPDRNLGRNIANLLSIPEDEQVLLNISTKSWEEAAAQRARLLLWPGYCPIHEKEMHVQQVDSFHRSFPGSRVLVHPECSPEVVARCDGAGSTAFLIKEVERAAFEGREKTLCVGTEFHLVHRLMERHAGRINVIPLAQATCGDMEKIDEFRLLSTLESLDTDEYVVTVEEDLKEPARATLVRMLEACR